MSRMTKFLMQTAIITFVERDSNGEPILDDYGEPKYKSNSMKVKCRRERATKDILTTGGAATMSTTKYFFDNSITVDIGDKVDSRVILTVSDYINAVGTSEGWEVTV